MAFPKKKSGPIKPAVPFTPKTPVAPAPAPAGGSLALGGGGRFAKLTDQLAAQGNVRNPQALAAKIGDAKLGKGKMQQLAAAGRKRGKK